MRAEPSPTGSRRSHLLMEGDSVGYIWIIALMDASLL
jgi:hypothetical protein